MAKVIYVKHLKKRQTFTFSTQANYFKINLRKLDLLKRC